MTNNSIYFTNIEAAEYLGVSVSTLTLWRKIKRDGKPVLPSFKMGRRVCFIKTDVEEFFRLCKKGEFRFK